MGYSLPDRWRSRLYAVRHKSYVRLFSGVAPYYLVNEFPKSGGSWLAQMLADALEAPFRRNEPIRYERAVTHGHFLHPAGLHNVVVMWRDPRDVLVSFYYHCYFLNEHNNAPLVRLMKDRCPFDDYTDIRANLPAFVRFVSESPVSPGFTWPDFARVWAGRAGVVHTSYEVLRADTPGELTRVIHGLTGTSISAARAVEVAEKYSFVRAKQAAETTRRSKTELSFVREGALGGWRKHFTQDAEQMLSAFEYHKSMRIVGYSPDHKSVIA